MSRTIFAFILCIGLASEHAYSHGGSFNAEGCHRNVKANEYHCHREFLKSGSSLKFEAKPKKTHSQETSEEILPYDRNLYGFKSYPANSSKGFYTGQFCDTNIDHVVSLKDAHESGADQWSMEARFLFANDKLNHVPSCSRINSSKGSSTPNDFFRKSSDGRGADYEIKSRCAYLKIYYQVKVKYRLSFDNNLPSIFAPCGLIIN